MNYTIGFVHFYHLLLIFNWTDLFLYVCKLFLRFNSFVVLATRLFSLWFIFYWVSSIGISSIFDKTFARVGDDSNYVVPVGDDSTYFIAFSFYNIVGVHYNIGLLVSLLQVSYGCFVCFPNTIVCSLRYCCLLITHFIVFSEDLFLG